MRNRLIVAGATALLLATAAQTAVVIGASVRPWSHVAALLALVALGSWSGAQLLGQRTMMLRQEAARTQLRQLSDTEPLLEAVAELNRASAASITWSIDARIVEFMRHHTGDGPPKND
jgi:hypothetical protein